MRFYLTKRETTHQAVQRIFIELIKQNIKLLNEHGENLDKSIHDARKNFKKLRAVLRLVKTDLSQHFYRTHNIHFRNLSRKIAGLRDSFVMIEALENLVKDHNDDLNNYDELVNSLQEEYHKTKNIILYEENRPLEVAKSLEFSLEEFSSMPHIENGFLTLGEGINKIYSKGKYFLNLTYSQTDSEIFHEWRKNVKYLWHLLQIVQPINYRVIKKLTVHFKQLSDFIGDEHDLYELKLLLNSKNLDSEKIINMINIKQFELRKEAWKLGETLYSKSSNNFIEELTGYYNKWKQS